MRDVLALKLAWLSTASSLPSADWLTDLDQAKEQARATARPILINFTGLDWCGWCMRLHNEVFSQTEFEACASGAFVPVKMDFPQRARRR